MTVTVSLVLLFGALLGFLLKAGSLKPGSAFVALIFGFLLASTGANQPITEFLSAAAHTLANLRP